MNETLRQRKIDILIEFINEQGQWADEYVSHEDNINSYAEMFEGENIHYGEIEDIEEEDIKRVIESMELSELWNFIEVELTCGIHRVTNEIESYNIGEIEVPLEGIYKNDHNCHYTYLCEGLTQDDIIEAKNESEFCTSGNYIYIDRSYDRVSIILKVDEIIEHYNQDKRKFLLDDHHGQYIPQFFINNFDFKLWNIENEENEENIKDIKEGPENENYWESWESIIESAFYIDENKEKWTLEQNGDLFCLNENYINTDI